MQQCMDNTLLITSNENHDNFTQLIMKLKISSYDIRTLVQESEGTPL